MKVRHNPKLTLAELADAFDRRATRSNPKARSALGGESARVFEAYVASGGRRPDEFPEADWRELLDARGVHDPDAQTAYLEGAAEW